MNFVYELTIINTNKTRDFLGQFESQWEAEQYAKQYMQIFDGVDCYEIKKHRKWF